MLKRLIASLCCLLFIPAAQAEVLRIASEGNYEPFSYLDKEGRHTGFDVEIAQALCKQMNRECQIEFLPWVELIPALENQKIDAIIASMAKTAEREKRVDFTNYYYSSHSLFVGTPNKVTDISPASMKGLRISVIDQTIQYHYVRAKYPDAVLQPTQTQEQAFQQLIANQTDLVFSDGINLLNFLQRPEGSSYEFIGNSLQSGALETKAHIAIRKGDFLLRDKFNTALEEIRLNGTYDRINRHYFPFSVY